MKGPDDYRGGQGFMYEAPPLLGFAVIEVLQFLWGQPWDDLALNYVHGLEPSYIRVIGPGHAMTSDAIRRRVSVLLEDDDRTIWRIEQSVGVGLVGVPGRGGHGLKIQLAERKKA